MFPAIYHLDLLLHLYFPLLLPKVRHHSCAMLRFKRLRCACTVSHGDHRNHTACLALEISREMTLLSAHCCTFSLSIDLELFTVYFKFSKASYSEKYREKYEATPQAQYKRKR